MHLIKDLQHKIKNMNSKVFMFFLLSFLFSTLAHADHLIEHSVNVQIEDCYICHQDIDTPEALFDIQKPPTYNYTFTLKSSTLAKAKANSFVLPHLRAPPSFH